MTGSRPVPDRQTGSWQTWFFAAMLALRPTEVLVIDLPVDVVERGRLMVRVRVATWRMRHRGLLVRGRLRRFPNATCARLDARRIGAWWGERAPETRPIADAQAAFAHGWDRRTRAPRLPPLTGA